jgi:hypothetical protein
MARSAGSDGDAKGCAAQMLRIVIHEGRVADGHRCPTRVEVGFGVHRNHTVRLVKTFEHVVNVLAKVLIRPADASRNIKLALQFIRRHKTTVLTSAVPSPRSLDPIPDH